MTPCTYCKGFGEVDTGGSTPYGGLITDACPYCDGEGQVRKYTIRENEDKTYELLRYGEPVGRPDNAQLEFWLELEDQSEKRRNAEKESTRMEEVILRIAARCDDWSNDEIKAACADALQCTVKELEDEISAEDEQ